MNNEVLLHKYTTEEKRDLVLSYLEKIELDVAPVELKTYGDDFVPGTPLKAVDYKTYYGITCSADNFTKYKVILRKSEQNYTYKFGYIGSETEEDKLWRKPLWDLISE